MFAKHLNRLHRLLVRNRLGLHDRYDLIDASFLIQLHTLDAAVRVSRDDDAPFAQGIGIHLGEGRPCCARSGIERDPSLLGLLLVLVVGLPEASARSPL